MTGPLLRQSSPQLQLCSRGAHGPSFAADQFCPREACLGPSWGMVRRSPVDLYSHRRSSLQVRVCHRGVLCMRLLSRPLASQPTSHRIFPRVHEHAAGSNAEATFLVHLGGVRPDSGAYLSELEALEFGAHNVKRCAKRGVDLPSLDWCPCAGLIVALPTEAEAGPWWNQQVGLTQCDTQRVTEFCGIGVCAYV